jgi:hypothetical protein
MRALGFMAIRSPCFGGFMVIVVQCEPVLYVTSVSAARAKHKISYTAD